MRNENNGIDLFSLRNVAFYRLFFKPKCAEFSVEPPTKMDLLTSQVASRSVKGYNYGP